MAPMKKKEMHDPIEMTRALLRVYVPTKLSAEEKAKAAAEAAARAAPPPPVPDGIAGTARQE